MGKEKQRNKRGEEIGGRRGRTGGQKEMMRGKKMRMERREYEGSGEERKEGKGGKRGDEIRE